MTTYNKLASSNEAQAVIEAELKLIETLKTYWCAITGRDTVDHNTITIIHSYVDRFGIETVLPWIKRAFNRCRDGADDCDMGRYISGMVRYNSDKENLVESFDDIVESFEDLVNRAK